MRAGDALTQRVVWALVGTVAVFVAVLACLAYVAFDQMEDDLVNDMLTNETSRLIKNVLSGAEDMSDGEPDEIGASMRAWLKPVGQTNNKIPALLRNLPEGLHQIQPDGNTWHVLVANTEKGEVVVLYDATQNEERVVSFGLTILGLGAVCMIGAYGLARRVAYLAVGPMVELTHRLSTWAPGAPGAPGLAVHREDEAGRLIEAFNRVQNQLDRSIAREREFAANLSHEVRTPLAAIRSDGELMLLTHELNADQEARLSRVVHNVDAVIGALEGARSLALERARPAERVFVAQCLADAWAGLAPQADAARLELVDHVPAGAALELDRYALLSVLRNLVSNAIEHAAPAKLTVSYADHTLTLTDTGPGIDAEKLPFVFERFYSGRLRDVAGPPGDAETETPDMQRGLGLAIAKRVCDMQHWRLSVDSRCQEPGRGTTFEVSFEAET
jgi:signal transduction histidine kinase